MVRFSCLEMESKACFVFGEKVLTTVTVRSMVLVLNNVLVTPEEFERLVIPEIFLQ